MTASCVGDLILICEEISGDREIASIIAPGEAQLGRWIRSRAAPDYDRANLVACQETRQTRGGRTGRRLPGKEGAGARIAKPSRVQQGRGKDMSLLQARNLLSQTHYIRTVQVRTGGSKICAVIDRVDRAQKVPL